MVKRNWWLDSVAHFVPLATAITLTMFMAYGLVQQTLRLWANFVPTQMVDAAIQKLENGTLPSGVISKDTVELTKSLSVFVMVYDKQGKIVSTDARLAGQIPELPSGVIAYALTNHENRVTWQPQPGVRQALVVKSYPGGVVASGQSLLETENLIALLTRDAVIGWAVALSLTWMVVMAVDSVRNQ